MLKKKAKRISLMLGGAGLLSALPITLASCSATIPTSDDTKSNLYNDYKYIYKDKKFTTIDDLTLDALDDVSDVQIHNFRNAGQAAAKEKIYHLYGQSFHSKKELYDYVASKMSITSGEYFLRSQVLSTSSSSIDGGLDSSLVFDEPTELVTIYKTYDNKYTLSETIARRSYYDTYEYFSLANGELFWSKEEAINYVHNSLEANLANVKEIRVYDPAGDGNYISEMELNDNLSNYIEKYIKIGDHYYKEDEISTKLPQITLDIDKIMPNVGVTHDPHPGLWFIGQDRQNSRGEWGGTKYYSDMTAPTNILDPSNWVVSSSSRDGLFGTIDYKKKMKDRLSQVDSMMSFLVRLNTKTSLKEDIPFQSIYNKAIRGVAIDLGEEAAVQLTYLMKSYGILDSAKVAWSSTFSFKNAGVLHAFSNVLVATFNAIEKLDFDRLEIELFDCFFKNLAIYFNATMRLYGMKKNYINIYAHSYDNLFKKYTSDVYKQSGDSSASNNLVYQLVPSELALGTIVSDSDLHSFTMLLFSVSNAVMMFNLSRQRIQESWASMKQIWKNKFFSGNTGVKTSAPMFVEGSEPHEVPLRDSEMRWENARDGSSELKNNKGQLISGDPITSSTSSSNYDDVRVKFLIHYSEGSGYEICDVRDPENIRFTSGTYRWGELPSELQNAKPGEIRRIIKNNDWTQFKSGPSGRVDITNLHELGIPYITSQYTARPHTQLPFDEELSEIIDHEPIYAKPNKLKQDFEATHSSESGASTIGEGELPPPPEELLNPNHQNPEHQQPHPSIPKPPPAPQIKEPTTINSPDYDGNRFIDIFTPTELSTLSKFTVDINRVHNNIRSEFGNKNFVDSNGLPIITRGQATGTAFEKANIEYIFSFDPIKRKYVSYKVGSEVGLDGQPTNPEIREFSALKTLPMDFKRYIDKHQVVRVTMKDFNTLIHPEARPTNLDDLHQFKDLKITLSHAEHEIQLTPKSPSFEPSEMTWVDDYNVFGFLNEKNVFVSTQNGLISSTEFIRTHTNGKRFLVGVDQELKDNGFVVFDLSNGTRKWYPNMNSLPREVTEQTSQLVTKWDIPEIMAAYKHRVGDPEPTYSNYPEDILAHVSTTHLPTWGELSTQFGQISSWGPRWYYSTATKGGVKFFYVFDRYNQIVVKTTKEDNFLTISTLNDGFSNALASERVPLSKDVWDQLVSNPKTTPEGLIDYKYYADQQIKTTLDFQKLESDTGATGGLPTDPEVVKQGLSGLKPNLTPSVDYLKVMGVQAIQKITPGKYGMNYKFDILKTFLEVPSETPVATNIEKFIKLARSHPTYVPLRTDIRKPAGEPLFCFSLEASDSGVPGARLNIKVDSHYYDGASRMSWETFKLLHENGLIQQVSSKKFAEMFIQFEGNRGINYMDSKTDAQRVNLFQFPETQADADAFVSFNHNLSILEVFNPYTHARYTFPLTEPKKLQEYFQKFSNFKNLISTDPRKIIITHQMEALANHDIGIHDIRLNDQDVTTLYSLLDRVWTSSTGQTFTFRDLGFGTRFNPNSPLPLPTSSPFGKEAHGSNLPYSLVELNAIWHSLPITRPKVTPVKRSLIIEDEMLSHSQNVDDSISNVDEIYVDSIAEDLTIMNSEFELEDKPIIRSTKNSHHNSKSSSKDKPDTHAHTHLLKVGSIDGEHIELNSLNGGGHGSGGSLGSASGASLASQTKMLETAFDDIEEFSRVNSDTGSLKTISRELREDVQKSSSWRSKTSKVGKAVWKGLGKGISGLLNATDGILLFLTVLEGLSSQILTTYAATLPNGEKVYWNGGISNKFLFDMISDGADYSINEAKFHVLEILSPEHESYFVYNHKRYASSREASMMVASELATNMFKAPGIAEVVYKPKTGTKYYTDLISLVKDMKQNSTTKYTNGFGIFDTALEALNDFKHMAINKNPNDIIIHTLKAKAKDNINNILGTEIIDYNIAGDTFKNKIKDFMHKIDALIALPEQKKVLWRDIVDNKYGRYEDVPVAKKRQLFKAWSHDGFVRYFGSRDSAISSYLSKIISYDKKAFFIEYIGMDKLKFIFDDIQFEDMKKFQDYLMETYKIS